MATLEDNRAAWSAGPVSRWSSIAPVELQEAHARGDALREWKLWTEHLAERKEPAPLEKLLHTKKSALLWNLPSHVRVQETFALAARLKGSRRERTRSFAGLEAAIAAWVRRAPEHQHKDRWAIECLVWAHALQDLAAILDRTSWWELVDHLVRIANDADAISFDESPLEQQWLAAELPLTLAYLLPELAVANALTTAAQNAYGHVFAEALDGEGLVHARHWSIARTLLAGWTRARTMGAKLDRGPWSGEAEDQYQWTCRQAFRMMRRDGTQLLVRDRSGGWNAELFSAIAGLVSDEDTQDVARLHLAKKPGKIETAGFPEPSVHSEWAETGVLRTGWNARSPRLGISYTGKRVDFELALGRDILWSGEWKCELTLNGQPVEQNGVWEEVCWVADDDVIYLELEAALNDSIRIQRQILLAREDNFLLLADAVLSTQHGSFALRSTLPVANDISFSPAEESREGFLEGRKYRAMVMPIGLPEWRSERRLGELQPTEHGLELMQHAEGTALFAPLWIDLDRKRMLKPCTWRQLTVACTRVIQPSDTAVGYRVQAGKKQWLVYRSLGEPANRTVLGHNLTSEYLVARFTREGTVEGLIEVE